MIFDGYCYCSSVKFNVELEHPTDDIYVSAYCTCDSCRRAHAAALYEVVYVKAKCFRFINGEEHVKSYQKKQGGPVRSFCGTCGSRCTIVVPGLSERLGGDYVGFFPNLLSPDSYAASRGVFVQSKVYCKEEHNLNMPLIKTLEGGDEVARACE